MAQTLSTWKLLIRSHGAGGVYIFFNFKHSNNLEITPFSGRANEQVAGQLRYRIFSVIEFRLVRDRRRRSRKPHQFHMWYAEQRRRLVQHGESECVQETCRVSAHGGDELSLRW